MISDVEIGYKCSRSEIMIVVSIDIVDRSRTK